MRLTVEEGVEDSYDSGLETTEESMTLCSKSVDVRVRCCDAVVIHCPLLSIFYGHNAVWITKMYNIVSCDCTDKIRYRLKDEVLKDGCHLFEPL